MPYPGMAIIGALATRQLPRTVATGLSHALAKSTGMRYNCSPSCLGCDVNSASGQVSLILFEVYRDARLGRAVPTIRKRCRAAMSIAGLARKFRPEIYTDPPTVQVGGPSFKSSNKEIRHVRKSAREAGTAVEEK